MITPSWTTTIAIVVTWLAIANNDVSIPEVIGERYSEPLSAIDAHPFAADDGFLWNPLNNKVFTTIARFGDVHTQIAILGDNPDLAEEREYDRSRTIIATELAFFSGNNACFRRRRGKPYGLRTIRRCHHNDRKIHYRQ